jgi:5-methyltetrahydrofolate--homocysteine methyltransferase
MQAYYQQAEALMGGGVDLFLVESIVDTLNAKAAIYALEELFAVKGVRVPVMLSCTIMQDSGRTPSGQTTEAFWNSVAHAKPFAVGLSGDLSSADMHPHVTHLSKCADCWVFCSPNTGVLLTHI